MSSQFYSTANTIVALLLAASLLIGCDIEVNNNVPDVPPEGRFAVVGANQHFNIDSIEVAIALFEDSIPIKLVGGDVVQASTADDSILLLQDGVYDGSYASSLPNAANFDQVDFLMLHEPILARQDRWYPTDLLSIDPGPGEFVGASAAIILPPVVLNLQSDLSNFSSIDDSFILTWTPLADGDLMKVRSAVTCKDGSNVYTYGTEAALLDTADNGSETIGLEQFIYDIDDTNDPPFSFLLGESRAALQELLTKLKDEGLANDFFNSFKLVNPINNECEIQLFLFRQRDGAFDDTATNGRIFGSRSADITLSYNPN